MATNFPAKYFILLANSPKEEIHRNNINAGLRIGLTFIGLGIIYFILAFLRVFIVHIAFLILIPLIFCIIGCIVLLINRYILEKK